MRPTVDDAELLQFIVKIIKNNLLQYIGPRDHNDFFINNYCSKFMKLIVLVNYQHERKKKKHSACLCDVPDSISWLYSDRCEI